jgi:hypothetical protein
MALWQQKALDRKAACPHSRNMSKSDIIKVRVTPEDKAAFDAVAKSKGKTASEILRATMARMIKRASQHREGAQ